MAFLLKFIFAVFAAVVVLVAGGVLQEYGHENSLESYSHHSYDEHSHPHYSFKYAIHDPHTGDVKDQWETREGDTVKGSYSLVEADGTVREVEYTADKKNGFNAVVKRKGKATHPEHHEYQQHQTEFQHHY